MLVFLLHSMKLLFTKPIPPNPAPSKIIPIISETLYIYLIGFQSETPYLIGFQTAFDDNRGQLIRLFAQFDNFRAVFVDFLLIHAVDFRQLCQILLPSGGNGAQGDFAAYLIGF